jgi:hypothetical protein
MHREDDAIAVDPNALGQRLLNGKTQLPAEMEVRFPFSMGARRSPRSIPLRPCLLSEDPPSALAHPLLNVAHGCAGRGPHQDGAIGSNRDP